MTTILLTCGETSGEAHGKRLVEELKALDPTCAVRALGGPELASAGAEIIAPLEKYAVMGFAEIVGKLPSFISLERSLDGLMKEGGIDLFIPIDYPGLNLRLCGRAKAARVPVLYFVSPQVWAWGGWRVRRMRRLVDLIGVILPFEVDIYRRAGIPVVFVGHPMLDEIAAPARPKEAPPRGARFEVLLLPGSRRQEFDRMFPLFCDAARLLKRRFEGASFTVGLAPLIPENAVRVPADMSGYCRFSRRGVDELVGASFAFATSGTVTLQCALSGTPMVVCYRTSLATYCIGKMLVRIPWIAMPNVLAGRRLIPELIQSNATRERIAEEASSILESPDAYRAASLGLLALRDRLSCPGGMARFARIALALARGETRDVPASRPGGEGCARR